MRRYLAGIALILATVACALNPIEVVEPGQGGTGGSSGGNSDSVGNAPQGETAQVVRVIDGDTIDVSMNGQTVRIRYLQINTTELSGNEPCSTEGRDANADLVEGQTVTLVADEDPTDPYDRALRHVFVGNTHVNAELVRQGWAEAVVYEPNDMYWEAFIELEQEAAAANRGCHGISDIFDDGTYRR